MILVPVNVDRFIRFDSTLVPDALLRQLTAALTAADPDDPQAVPVCMWGKDHEGQLVMPRGFALKFSKGLAHYGYQPRWIDNRVRVPITIGNNLGLDVSMTPRSYQQKAIIRMRDVQQGIYEAPPGSGKTISSAFFIAEIQQRTIILVDKINIANQWRDRLRDALGIECGLIGDDVWDEREVTIALRQTLWAARETLDASGWWSRFGCMMMDECHGISALTVRDLIQRFPAYWRIGVSATPDRHEWMLMISRSIFGEIICRTTDKELEDTGVLVRPRIVAVRTPFVFQWKTRDSKGRRVSGKVQWDKMLKELKFDPARNKLFGDLAGKQRGHTCLVHTEHKQHAVELAAYALAAGWPDANVFFFTGDQDAEERRQIVERASLGDCIIFSTIGKEAMDIPRLDRFFMVFPTKNETAVKQMVGRLKRTHVSKTEAPIAYDFFDDGCRITREHFAARRGAYDRDELPLTII